eukprot:gene16866-20051_t
MSNKEQQQGPITTLEGLLVRLEELLADSDYKDVAFSKVRKRKNEKEERLFLGRIGSLMRQLVEFKAERTMVHIFHLRFIHTAAPIRRHRSCKITSQLTEYLRIMNKHAVGQDSSSSSSSQPTNSFGGSINMSSYQDLGSSLTSLPDMMTDSPVSTPSPSAASPPMAVPSPGMPSPQLSATISLAKEIPEVKAARELLDYLTTHKIDPDNSLVGCELNSSYLDGLLKFKSQHSYNKRSLVKMIKNWGQLKDESLVKEVRRMSSVLNHMDFKRGELVIVDINHINNNNNSAKDDDTDDAFFDLDFDDEEFNRTCKLYTNPSEDDRTQLSFDIANIYKLSPEILEQIRSERIKLVSDPSIPFHHMLTFKEKAIVNRYLESKGVDTSIFDKSRNNTITLADSPMVKKCLNETSLLEQTFDKSPIVQELYQMVKQESRPFLETVRRTCFYIPLLTQLEDSVKSIEIDRLKRLRARLTQSIVSLDSSCFKLLTEKKDILNGSAKNYLSNWWLTLIREHIESLLIKNGFDFNAVPQDYLEKPPQNFSSGQEDSKHRKEFNRVVQRLMETIYPVIEEFVVKCKLVILDAFELFDSTIGQLEAKGLMDLAALKDMYAKKKDTLDKAKACHVDRIFKDIDYILEMKRLETIPGEKRLDIVPISGLAYGRVYRLENEMRTVLDIWKPNESTLARELSPNHSPNNSFILYGTSNSGSNGNLGLLGTSSQRDPVLSASYIAEHFPPQKPLPPPPALKKDSKKWNEPSKPINRGSSIQILTNQRLKNQAIFQNHRDREIPTAASLFAPDLLSTASNSSKTSSSDSIYTVDDDTTSEFSNIE